MVANYCGTPTERATRLTQVAETFGRQHTHPRKVLRILLQPLLWVMHPAWQARTSERLGSSGSYAMKGHWISPWQFDGGVQTDPLGVLRQRSRGFASLLEIRGMGPMASGALHCWTTLPGESPKASTYWRTKFTRRRSAALVGLHSPNCV